MASVDGGGGAASGSAHSSGSKLNDSGAELSVMKGSSSGAMQLGVSSSMGTTGKKITKDVRDAKLNSWREKMNSWGFRNGAVDNIKFKGTPGSHEGLRSAGSGEALEEIMLKSGNPSPEKLLMSASAASGTSSAQ